MSAVKQVTDATFSAEVLRASKPTIVDFFATWCGPCQRTEPILERFAKSQNKILVARLDVDENPMVTAQYDISAMPTVILFRDGKKIKEHVGAFPNEVAIKAWVEEPVPSS